MNENIAVAEFDYEEMEEDEISFVEGDRLTVIEKLEGDTWCRGVNQRTGQAGIYPANFVRFL